MMSPGKLFLRRLSSELKFQISIWRTTIDWTVVLYILLPAIALGINQYLLWWKSSPVFLNLLSISLLYALCYLFAWSGSIRIFLQEGDQLFLLNQKQWLKQIMKYGLIYSFSLYFLLNGLFFVFLAPFIFKHYHLSQFQFIALLSITFLSKVVLGLSKQLLVLHFYGWRQSVVISGTMVLASLLFILLISHIINNFILFLASILFLLIIIAILSMKRLNYKGGFFEDVAREQNAKLKYVSFLLGLSGINIKKAKKQRKRPRLFPRSNIIFKKRSAVNGLVEFFLKSTIRNSRHLLQYLQFLFICLLIVLSVPDSAKWPILVALTFILVNFVGLYWKEGMASEFIQLFYWKPEDKHLALQKFLFIMILPGALLISLIAGLQIFSWMGALFILSVDIGVVFYIAKIVSFYLIVTTKK